MRPMLDKTELPQVQQITTLNRRALAEHKPPGMAGSLFQDLGRHSTRLVVSGVATGPNALKVVEDLDKKFKAQKPLSFTADIAAASKIDQMLIENLSVEELAGKPERFAYVLTLGEYIKPAAAETSPSIDGDIAGDAKNLTDAMLPGLVNGPAIAAGLQKFVTQFSGLLARL